MRKDWEYKKLGEVAISDLGKTLNKSKDTGTLYPYLCAINILWDKIDLSTLKETRFEDDELERYTVKYGDLLVCEGGDTGRAAIWDKQETMLYQNALHRIRLNNEINSRFLLYYLWQLKLNGEIDAKYSKGVTIKHLVKSSLMSIPIPIPPKPTQLAIVAELDKINELIQLKKQQLKDYDQLAQSIFYEMFGDPVENEKGWEVKKLGEICDIRDGTHDSPKYVEHSDYLLITSKNIENNFISFENVNYITEEDFLRINKRSKVDDGDIIMPMIGTIGNPIIVKLVNNINFAIKNVALIKFYSTSSVINYYLQSLMKSSSFEKDITRFHKGGTQKFIALGTIRNFKIPLPPLPLQQQFAARIEAIERQKQQVSETIKDLETLLASRMQYWFD